MVNLTNFYTLALTEKINETNNLKLKSHKYQIIKTFFKELKKCKFEKSNLKKICTSKEKLFYNNDNFSCTFGTEWYTYENVPNYENLEHLVSFDFYINMKDGQKAIIEYKNNIKINKNHKKKPYFLKTTMEKTTVESFLVWANKENINKLISISNISILEK